MRERMVQHRANPACASCHAMMDPLGLALENFDARRPVPDARRVVRSRSTRRASLPDGTTVRRAPPGCAQALLARPDQFVTTLTEKLLTYALGRGVEYYDAPAVRAIVRDAARQRLPLLVGARFSGVVRERAVSDEENAES